MLDVRVALLQHLLLFQVAVRLERETGDKAGVRAGSSWRFILASEAPARSHASPTHHAEPLGRPASDGGLRSTQLTLVHFAPETELDERGEYRVEKRWGGPGEQHRSVKQRPRLHSAQST